MCSIEEGDVLLPPKSMKSSVEGRTCMKCKTEQAVVIIRIDDPYCRDCFLGYCTHKFRSAFGKSRLIRDKEEVLVAYSGGAASVSMVHLIQEGLSKRAHKKLRFLPSLVYIDEGSVINHDSTEREITEEVARKMHASGVECYAFALEQAMTLTSDNTASCTLQLQTLDAFMSREHLKESDADKEKQLLLSLLASAKSLTAKENLVCLLRHRLLVHAARMLGYSKVLMGDSASRLAVHLISSMTQGTGGHLHYEMSFADHRLSDVTLVRPMRDFTGKEITVYNMLNQLTCVTIPTLSTKVDRFASLDRLTESFVMGLQADFPNTVSTILRTGEKLTSSSTGNLEAGTCPLCQAPMDTDVGLSSALSATEFSQSLCHSMHQKKCGDQSCNHGECQSAMLDGCCGEGEGSCQKDKINGMGKQELKESLCYGCRLIIKDMDSVGTLPNEVLQNAASNKARRAMRSSIAEYILDTEET